MQALQQQNLAYEDENSTKPKHHPINTLRTLNSIYLTC